MGEIRFDHIAAQTAITEIRNLRYLYLPSLFNFKDCQYRRMV